MLETVRCLLLLPFSILYALITGIRNLLFNVGILNETSFGIPVIGVGNLSFGGSGKTVIVEYLLDFLQRKGIKPALLSRGYGRKTKGFLIANPSGTADSYGDEPLQVACKFPNIPIAVCENRVRGINEMVEKFPDINTVILDDSFQHRYVKPHLNILLTEYGRPYFNDIIMPSGRLREMTAGRKRADIVVVTKCPPKLKPEEAQKFTNKLHAEPKCDVYFASIEYENPIYFSNKKNIDLKINQRSAIIAFCGIANPEPFLEKVKSLTPNFSFYKFADHHRYCFKDCQEIINAFRKSAGDEKIILTTEKDISRIRNTEEEALFVDLPLYFLPVKSVFLFDGEESFENKILNTCLKKSRKPQHL
jgi:tetraacyldisaccharide 4'-kinase